MINRADELYWLIDFLYNEYVEDLFIKEEDRYVKMCYDVIKHDAEERLGRDLNDIEIGFVKLSVKDKIRLCNEA